MAENKGQHFPAGPRGRACADFGVDYKLWLKKNGAVFGGGLFILLRHVGICGSISQAAREMGMSYRAAWGKVKDAENSWKMTLVNTRVGGELGGGASLTPGAEELLQKYSSLKQELDQTVQNIFEKIFESHSGS